MVLSKEVWSEEVWSKECPCCSKSKNSSEYARDPNRADGMTRCCKECRGTDEDEVVFSITIHTKGGLSIQRGLQVTKECIQNLDVSYLMYSLRCLVERGALSKKQLSLLFDFGQMLVEAKEAKVFLDDE